MAPVASRPLGAAPARNLLTDRENVTARNGSRTTRGWTQWGWGNMAPGRKVGAFNNRSPADTWSTVPSGTFSDYGPRAVSDGCSTSERRPFGSRRTHVYRSHRTPRNGRAALSAGPDRCSCGRNAPLGGGTRRHNANTETARARRTSDRRYRAVLICSAARDDATDDR